jgi:hypothetical protein
MLSRPKFCEEGYMQTHLDSDCVGEFCVVTLWGFLDELPRTTLPAEMFEAFMARRAWGGGNPPAHSYAVTDDDHWQRVMDADLAYPIMFRHSPNGDVRIVDGYHRIIRAFLLDRPWILAVDVTSVLEHARLEPGWDDSIEGLQSA